MGNSKRIRSAVVGGTMIALIAGAATLPAVSLTADGTTAGTGKVTIGDIHFVKKVDRAGSLLG